MENCGSQIHCRTQYNRVGFYGNSQWTCDMISYSLNNQISLEKLGSDIQSYINKYKKDNPEDKDLILVIKLQKITQETNELIPKLEFKN